MVATFESGHARRQADVVRKAQRSSDLLLKEAPEAPVVWVCAADEFALTKYSFTVVVAMPCTKSQAGLCLARIEASASKSASTWGLAVRRWRTGQPDG